MALVEYYIGNVGPLYIDDTDPLYTDDYQMALKKDIGQPATTVVSETSFGQASAVGSSVKFAREDHTHGTPVLEIGKIKFSAEGGLLVLLTNKTGAASVKGTVVCASSTDNNAVEKVVVDVPDAFGVIYTDNIADGAPVWVVVSGIAEVYFVGSTTRKYLARTFITSDGASYVAGQALAEAVPTAPFATDKHFCEIGHVLESRTGAGLAKVLLHFN